MDYQRIFESDFGIQKIKYRGTQGLGLCPFHDDHNPSLSWQLDTGLWTCFSGCGSGNTYQFAERLNLPNPRQYIESSIIDSKNYRNGEYKLINTFKSEDTDVFQVDKIERLEQLKERYGKNHFGADSMILGKDKFKGKDDDGKAVFFYEYGIKYHKCSPFWHPDSLDKGLQIFMAELIDESQDKLYICEGEKDAYNFPSWLNAVCFSAGAGSIPKDLSSIYYDNLKTIVIPYDKDKAGNGGMKKLAEHIKSERPDLIVRMLKWDDDLPDGFDITDALDKGMDFFNGVLENTEEYHLELPTTLKGFKVMDANELINTYKEPPKHIVEHMMVEGGVSLISGTDGVGKTWFGLQMGICIASGKEFLGFAVKKKPVLIIQFELSPEQLSDRLKKYDLNGTEGFLDFVVLKDDDLIFTDAWKKIEQTIDARGLVDGVVLIDNLYTSTNADVSKNQDLKPLLIIVDRLKRTTGNAFALFGHHNKHEGDREPILTKNIITGGKTLTNYVSNVFQLGNSSMGADVRRGKITKTRDSYTDLEHLPIRLEWNPEECLFSRQGIISNELLHTIQMEKQWEIKVLCELADYMNNEDEFDRQRLMPFIESMFPLETPDTNYKKGTRWLKKMESYGLISGGNNRYKLNRDEIRYLESENEKSK